MTGADRSAPRRSRLHALAALVSLLSLGAVAWWAADQPAPRLPDAPADWAQLAAGLAAYAVATALRAERWRALLEREGARPHRADCYGLTLVGYMGNNVLPARAGDALRVVVMAPLAGTGMRTVLGTLVAERVLDVLTLFGVFFVLAFGLANGAGDVPQGTWIALAALAAGGAALLGGLAVARRRPHGRIGRLSAFAAPILAATTRLRGRWGATMLALTIAVWIAEAGTWLAVGAAVDLGIGPLDALYLVALASLFVFVPAGPGYAGTLDAAVVVGVRALGRSGSQAVGYLLLLRFVLLVPITIAGLVALIARYGGLRALGRSAAAASGRSGP